MGTTPACIAWARARGRACAAASPAVSGRLPRDVLDAADECVVDFCTRCPRAPAAADAEAVAVACKRMPPRPAAPAVVAFMPLPNGSGGMSRQVAVFRGASKLLCSQGPMASLDAQFGVLLSRRSSQLVLAARLRGPSRSWADLVAICRTLADKDECGSPSPNHAATSPLASPATTLLDAAACSHPWPSSGTCACSNAYRVARRPTAAHQGL